MLALVGPVGGRTNQIFRRTRTGDIRVLERLPRRGTPSSVRTKHAGLAKARPCKWGSCPSLGLSARAFHVHLWKAQEISASQPPGKTGSNTVSGSCAQGCAAHTSKDTRRKAWFVARERKKVAAFVCEDEPSGECS